MSIAGVFRIGTAVGTMAAKDTAGVSAARRGQRLTPREREVLGALCVGGNRQEIAALLNLSVKTVDIYLQNARIKLGARTLPAAVFEYVTRYRSDV